MFNDSLLHLTLKTLVRVFNWASTKLVDAEVDVRGIPLSKTAASIGFTAFGKGMRLLINGSSFDETEQLYRLTSQSGILATS